MRNSITQEATPLLKKTVEDATRRGAAAARISIQNEESQSCSFENGRLKETNADQNLGFSVTVLVDGKLGAARGNDLNDLNEITDRAFALAEVGSVAHFDAFPAPADCMDVKTFSERTTQLTREQMIESCQSMVETFKAYNSELFISAGATRGESEGLLVTSGGVCHISRNSAWSLGSYLQRTEGTDMLFVGYGQRWRDLNELYDPDYIVERVMEDLHRSETLTDAPNGKVQALLDPQTFRMLLYAVDMGINGRSVAKGDSPLRGRLGEQILSPAITMIDDPHLDYASGAAVIDSSGIPTRVNPIVEKGVLKNFLYDLDSAGLADAQPTGNDGCSAYAMKILPGTRTDAELLASMDDGIIVKDLLGFGQGNLINGDFSCNVALGYRVKNGKVVGRFKNAMIASNTYDLFKTDVELSSNYEPGRRIPHALVGNLSISAANGS